MENVVQLTASGDYVSLPDEEHYRIYFDQMRRVCEVLRNWSESEMGSSSPEGECIGFFGNRILQSIELLRLKYLVDVDDRMKLDLNESGFPHLNEIVRLENDAEHAEDTLKRIPPRPILIEEALDVVFNENTTPLAVLENLGRRKYLEALLEQEFMGAFCFGEVKQHSGSRFNRRYVCSWACYNTEDNLIYLTWLEFDQDSDDSPMMKGSSSYNELRETIERLGRRISPLAVFATELDRELASVHPKAIRRLRLGPILSTRFSFDDCDLAKFLRRSGDPDDVLFSMECEVIVSSRQVVKERGWLLLPDTLQEVFEVPHDDPECFDRKLSDVKRYLFMPHHLWQTTFAEKNPRWLKGYEKAVRYAFENDGSLFGI